jgi:hypothetical protein
MFVPSLYIYKWLKKTVFTHRARFCEAPCLYRNRSFVKTGLGQTQGRLVVVSTQEPNIFAMGGQFTEFSLIRLDLQEPQEVVAGHGHEGHHGYT